MKELQELINKWEVYNGLSSKRAINAQHTAEINHFVGRGQAINEFIQDLNTLKQSLKD